MPIGSLVNGLAQGYQAGQQAMDQHRVAQLREEKLRRELEQQQAMEDAAAQAQEAATTQPAGYSGQQAMEGTTTVSAPHAYSGQGTDMSIANVYDQGPAMEGGLRDQVTTQQPGGFALPTQTEQGLKDPQKFDYREYLSNLGQEVAKRDPQQAAEIHDTLNSLADEGFQEFAKSLMLGDTDRAEQEYNLTGQGRIKPGSLKVDYDQGTVSLVDQDGEQQTMDLDTVFALGGVQPEDPFDVGPGHALVSGSGEEIYKNPKPQEEGRPSASLYNAASRALGQAIGGEFQNGVFTGTTPGKTEWFLNAQEVSHNLVDQGVNPGQAAQLAYTQTRKQVPQISDWEAKAQAKKQLEQEQAQQIGSKWNPANWGDWWNAPDISQQQIQDRANLIQDRSKPAYQGATDALGMGSGPGSMPRDQGSGVPSRSGAAGQKSAPVAEQAGQGEQPKKNRATQVRKIPEEAIRQLKKNPSKKMKQYFDEAFGDGAADYVLSEE